jgi:hypothetical protein
MMKYVISANYRDKDSPFKWLVREEGVAPENAVPHKIVRAKGVIFCPSSTYETGFGCSVVAFAEELMDEASAVPDEAVQLTFVNAGRRSYFEDINCTRHEKLAEMYLDENGIVKGIPIPQ